MRILWNHLKADERKALADLMALQHADYLCTAIKKAKRCRDEKGR
jgi:hypothetical protein